MEQQVKIFVVTHKAFKIPKDNLYVPIQVGREFTKLNLNFLSDDTLDNIADKNKNYCELTALYWIWKNVINTKIIGLCHYRRYFTRNNLFSNEIFFLDMQDILGILRNYDIIVPVAENWRDKTVRQHYSMYAGKDIDIEETRKVIKSLYPDYICEFDLVLNDSKAFYCNMFIAERNLVGDYCTWLFNILEALEKKIDISEYNVKEARIYGYLSEILLNVWVIHNKLRCKEIPIVNTESSFKYRVVQKLNKFSIV